MTNQTHPYGPLLVTLTTAYDLRWSDKGSGGKKDASFWHAKSQGDLRPLGTVALQGYDDPNNRRAALLIGPHGQASVAPPIRYDQVYNDKGTGSNRDGSIWRPVAPASYHALGDVVAAGYNAPSLDDIWCVRSDLVTAGKFSDLVWDDHGTGGDNDVSIWDVQPRDAHFEADKVPFSGDTFISANNYSAPNNALAKALLVDVPAHIFEGGSREAPRLTSKVAPSASTALELDRSVVIPFTCVFPANDQTSVDLIFNPFISIEQWGNWTLALFDNNTVSVKQSSSQEITTGITNSQTETFEHSTGVKISAEVGVELVGKVTTELYYQFTYTTSASTETLRSQTITHTLTTPPQHAAALWVKHLAYRAVRLADGSIIGQDLPFDLPVTSRSQFPEDELGGCLCGMKLQAEQSKLYRF
ncbi:uncharacterized protein LY89DRAFT_239696 [Mollisia scopiformis]|uniref:Uncharacterized protein n=1 Tax=Mollisia scopiformis TaxID=149040 RepID=A0A194WTD1_MOLSC|nr:uncharacterized protein LY89DRAFT_239696 [Mollisia scopiformis]KUJ11218.1 hypothetical protein LY89DRAFT_239696 [Mollisia scopiformis]